MDGNEIVQSQNLNENQTEKKTKKSNGFVLGVIVGMLSMFLIFAIAAGAIVYEYTISGSTIINYSVSTKMRLIENLIGKYYLDSDDVTSSDIEDGIYAGMVKALGDPYSVYYTTEDYTALKEATSGTFEGVGMYLSTDKDTNLVKVVKPMDESPAQKAGVMADDIIYKVDGEDITGMDLSTVVAKVKGPKGSSVVITVIRDGEEIDFTLVRDTIKVSTVSSEMKDDKIGYIQIAEFDTITFDQFEKAIDDLEKDGMERLIIDLRGNPGGDVDAVCDIADRLLPEGVVVSTKDKYGKTREFKSEAAHYFDKPLVVLVDGASASASEILTGAIKDYGTGTIVGKTTFGKGIVQHVISLGDGSGIKLTVEDYYTPSGNNIHKVGITPDVEVDFDAEAYLKDKTDTQLDKAIEVVKKIQK